MNHRFISFALSTLVLLEAQVLTHEAQAVSRSVQPEKLEHMEYARARRIILGYGWKPVSGPCEQVLKDECTRFPEIGVCSGVAPGYCSMVFVRQDQCLFLVTSGGEPEGAEEGDTHVETVTFRRGPCSKYGS